MVLLDERDQRDIDTRADDTVETDMAEVKQVAMGRQVGVGCLKDANANDRSFCARSTISKEKKPRCKRH